MVRNLMENYWGLLEISPHSRPCLESTIVPAGRGGIVYTKGKDLYWKIRRASDRGKPFGLPAGSTNVIASLNLNLNDLSAVIGREQLKKLSGIVEDRCQFVEKLKEGFKDLKTLIIPGLIPGAEPSYWWWRLEVNTDMISCDKETYCRALIEEGISLNPSYRAAIPHNMDWFKNRSVFGTSGYPWAAPEYKGDRNRQFSCPNAMLATERQFNLTVYESWGRRRSGRYYNGILKGRKCFH